MHRLATLTIITESYNQTLLRINVTYVQRALSQIVARENEYFLPNYHQLRKKKKKANRPRRCCCCCCRWKEKRKLEKLSEQHFSHATRPIRYTLKKLFYYLKNKNNRVVNV